jgi:hypothetical protein
MQHPRIFGRGHIGREWTNIAPVSWRGKTNAGCAHGEDTRVQLIGRTQQSLIILKSNRHMLVVANREEPTERLYIQLTAVNAGKKSQGLQFTERTLGGFSEMERKIQRLQLRERIQDFHSWRGHKVEVHGMKKQRLHLMEKTQGCSCSSWEGHRRGCISWKGHHGGCSTRKKPKVAIHAEDTRSPLMEWTQG